MPAVHGWSCPPPAVPRVRLRGARSRRRAGRVTGRRSAGCSSFLHSRPAIIEQPPSAEPPAPPRVLLTTARHQGALQWRTAIVAPLFLEVLMRTKSRVIAGVMAATLLTQLTACGSTFYPDRRGQTEGRIDPVIAGANAIGILFYVIPGLIAFAVDFATGAIYLPEGQTAQVDPQQLKQLIGNDGKVAQYAPNTLHETTTGHQLPRHVPRLIQHSGSAEQLAAYGLRPAA